MLIRVKDLGSISSKLPSPQKQPLRETSLQLDLQEMATKQWLWFYQVAAVCSFSVVLQLLRLVGSPEFLLQVTPGNSTDTASTTLFVFPPKSVFRFPGCLQAAPLPLLISLRTWRFFEASENLTWRKQPQCKQRDLVLGHVSLERCQAPFLANQKLRNLLKTVKWNLSVRTFCKQDNFSFPQEALVQEVNLNSYWKSVLLLTCISISKKEKRAF